MENTMRELSFKEVEDVSGGWIFPFLFGAVPTFFRTSIYSPSVGRGSDNPPRFDDATHINNNSYAFA